MSSRRRRQQQACFGGNQQGSFLRLLKISQVGRMLILSGRHEITIPAQEIIIFANVDVMIVLVAIVLYPSNVGRSPIGLVDCPRMREGRT
jgi:hypothetical protein